LSVPVRRSLLDGPASPVAGSDKRSFVLITSDIAREIRPLKGAPLSILIAVSLADSDTFTQEWAGTVTAYESNALRSGIRALIALGFVAQVSRYEYTLTMKALQLPLLTVEKTRSRSSVLINSIEDSTTYTYATVEKPRSELAAHLHRLGCDPTKAERSLSEAMRAAGGDAGKVENILLAWIAYCASPRGSTIHSPGALVAKRIETLTPPPSLPQLTGTGDYSGYDQFITRQDDNFESE